MSTITLEVPDTIADEIEQNQNRLPEILASGLEAVRTRGQASQVGAAEIYAFFARRPSPEDILALRPSRSYQGRLDTLLRKSRDKRLAPDEQAEWEEYELVEHLVRLAKAMARKQLRAVGESGPDVRSTGR